VIIRHVREIVNFNTVGRLLMYMTSDIDINVTDNGIEVNDYIFNVDEFKRIKTRILRNKFKGDYSPIQGMGGTTVIRAGDVLMLGTPEGFPKESWTYKEWVRQADGWREYAKGTPEEWNAAFNTLDI